VKSLQVQDADEAVVAIKRLSISPQDTVVSSSGTDELFYRLIEVPFTDLKKIEQAAPLEAEETLPLPIEQTVGDVQLLKSTAGRSQVLYTATPIAAVEKKLEVFSSSGTTVHTLDAEPLALATVAQKSLGPDEKAWVVNIDRARVQAVFVSQLGALRFTTLAMVHNTALLAKELQRHVGLAEEQGLSATTLYLSGDQATEGICAEWTEALGMSVALLPYPTGVGQPPDDAPAWPLWAVELGAGLRELTADRAHRVNLLQGPFAPAKTITAWSAKAVTVGIFALVLFTVWGLGAWVEAKGKEDRVTAVKSTIRELFTTALPEVKNARTDTEVEQLLERVKDLEERAKSLGSLLVREVSPLSVLRQVSQELPKNIEVEFREFLAEEDRVKIEGITTSFDAIDRIQGKLEQYPWFQSVTVSDAKSGIDPGKVIFKLTIELGSPET
jgi:general secretion pathway protein L